MKRNIIIGGGIAGLCTAYHLIQNGEHVTLIEEGRIGDKASSKAAGMVTPASEVHLSETELMKCFLECIDYYPSFVATLTDNQPDLIDYRRNGSLMCATDQDGQRELMRLFEFQKNMGLDTTEISPTEVATLEPMLAQRICYGLFAQNEACLDNIKLIAQLKRILLASDLCEILENQVVSQLVVKNDSVQKIFLGNSSGHTIEANRFILTTGVSHGINHLNDYLSLPLRPVRGQVLTVQCQPNTIHRPVRMYHRYPIYLVPRADGRIVIGATSEELAEEYVTAGGIMDLIYAAWQILPVIFDSAIVETNVGFRPASPDHKPIAGSTNVKNLFVLTGLYRHGIMAAPYLAKELVNLICDKETNLNWQEFSLDRFKTAVSLCRSAVVS